MMVGWLDELVGTPSEPVWVGTASSRGTHPLGSGERQYV
jgi:hypothetical protein